MPRMNRRVLLFGVLLCATPLLLPPAVGLQMAPAAPAAAPTKVMHVLGFENVKKNAKGTLTIDGEFLKFQSAGGNTQLALGAIENVTTGDDSKRLVGGTLGMLSMFAPYGSGRFLSLFRTPVDVITLEYRDANGGLHGAILTMSDGAAEPLKQKLVAGGAHALPVPEPPAAPAAAPKEKK